jgi:hypothetical protein
MNILLHAGDLVRVSHATEKARDFTGIILEICDKTIGRPLRVLVLWADGSIQHVPEYILKKVTT